MKKFILLLCSLILVIGAVGTASAVPWTWEDSWDPTDVLLNKDSKFYHYQHNITDTGFSPLSDFVTDFTLRVFLKDDATDGYESAYISAPLTGGIYDFRFRSNTFGATLAGLIEINALGILDVTLSRLWGDFYFDRSYFTATGFETSPAAAVPTPEPATLLLMGAGLMGLVFLSRKRLGK